MSEDILDDILGDLTETKKNKEEIAVNEEVSVQEEILETTEKNDNSEFLPGCGVDIGTSNIVVARRNKEGEFVNRFHRNMLYPLDVSEEAVDLLEKSNYLYVKVGDKYFVVGEDALTLVNAIGKGEVVRPMKDGILNPSLKESSELLFYIVKTVVGPPIVEGETLRFSVPADPVDSNINNKFHEMILTNFFKKMGYDPKPVNEAMCIAYDCNPVMKEDDGDVPLSGVALSCGAGMSNIALCYKGLPLQEFSVTKSGDYIDEQASLMTGTKKGKVLKIKEKKLDLNNLDFSDRVQAALGVYYEETMERMMHHISQKFKNIESELDGEIEIVVAGGTSMVKGFCKKLEAIVENSDLPFNVYRVRHSDTPFYSVSQGACIRAQADFKKKI
jgi:actin-like ATPase involved in cell morphogenesis